MYPNKAINVKIQKEINSKIPILKSKKLIKSSLKKNNPIGDNPKRNIKNIIP
jgi:hypothetical protein